MKVLSISLSFFHCLASFRLIARTSAPTYAEYGVGSRLCLVKRTRTDCVEESCKRLIMLQNSISPLTDYRVDPKSQFF
ncbi:hypothetical protein BDR06DRAFT_953978 [Suillus hirtellus]|nr:hypothetical protein BDR06DRAFT_953978 [Suillus hirtellus]